MRISWLYIANAHLSIGFFIAKLSFAPTSST